MSLARNVLGSAVALMAALSLACGDSPVQPSNPPPTPPTTPTDNLVVRFTVTADASGARDAVAGLSEVLVDASTSTGAGALTFAIDFGDGFRATTASARHTYTAPGTFTIAVDVRDAQGRTASSTQAVSIKALGGSWFHAFYNANVHRVEIRRLEITSHEGQTVRGVYKLSNAPDRAFVGRLNPPRSISITADSTTFDGTIPGRLDEETERWTLQARGANLNGDRLEFRPIVGAPAGPPPDADLRVRFDNLGSLQPIVALSPIQFDGSGSRGTGLSYVLEFGDEQAAAEARAVHAVSRPGLLTARLTVVDRFGRFDTESIPYGVFALNQLSSMWYYPDGNAEFVRFRFTTRDGINYQGFAWYGLSGQQFDSVPFSATLSGERDIRIVVPALGLEFRGYLDMTKLKSNDPPMTLTQFGGAHNGKVRTLFYDDGPG